MTPKDDLLKLQQVATRIADDMEKLEELSDDDAQVLIETLQVIEDKLSEVLAKYGVEIGDERVD